MKFKLGIIAGGGNLPSSIADAYKINGGECFIAGLKGYAEPKLFDKFSYKSFKIGNVGAILEFFKNNNVTKIAFAGRVNRPNLSNIQADFMGCILLARILKAKILGDDSLLQIITNFVEEKGYEVISASDLLAQNAISAIKSNNQPAKQDLVDIDFGVKVTRALGNLDIGQAVIVQNGYVVGIEAAEGTDNLIKRCSELRVTNKGGVLIKMMKSFQDRRLDIPTIGPQTIELLALYNYSGIAIEKNKVIVVEAQKTIDLADQHKIFITEI